MPALAVSAHGLTKRYRARRGPPILAVDRVDLEIPTGLLLGFLGPNGAGKTTLMDMIRGGLPATAGRLTVLGLPLPAAARRIKARLGVVPQENNLDPDFTVRKNLLVYARYFGLPRRAAADRADDLLSFVGLSDRAETNVEELSGGMKRRLVLARSLLNEPELLVLDEPTSGLDPQARHLVWDKVRSLRRQGLTILLTTHYMEEAQRLCDDVAVIDHGTVLERGAPEDLVARHAGRDVVELTFPDTHPPPTDDAHALLRPHERLETVGDRLLVYTDDADALAPRLRHGLAPERVLVRRADLEDVFLRLTGRDLRE